MRWHEMDRWMKAAEIGQWIILAVLVVFMGWLFFAV